MFCLELLFSSRGGFRFCSVIIAISAMDSDAFSRRSDHCRDILLSEVGGEHRVAMLDLNSGRTLYTIAINRFKKFIKTVGRNQDLFRAM